MNVSVSKFRQQILTVRQPEGLLAMSVLRPDSAPKRRHRELLLASMPRRSRLLAWTFLLWQGVRWRLATSTMIARWADRLAAEVVRTHGVSVDDQRASMHRLMRSDGIAPHDFYRLRLFEPERFAQRWSYVYDCEVAAFHTSRNLPGAVQGDLSDKQLNAELFQSEGIAVAETLAQLPRQSTWRDLPDRGDALMFCKPRRGSAARGVFRARRSGEEIDAWRLDGKPFEDASSEVNSLLGTADYIVQPYYETHDDMADLGRSVDDALTARVITERNSDGTITLYCAYLEVPVRSNGMNFYIPIEVDVATGRVGRIAPRPYRVEPAALQRLQDQARNRQVPEWATTLDHATRAHELIKGRRGIAWDFIVSPAGPVLLEGNANWALVVPQLFRGPLLAESQP